MAGATAAAALDMPVCPSFLVRTLGLPVSVLVGVSVCSLAGRSNAGAAAHAWARTVSFETNEVTDVSLDLSPDGRTLVFGLLGDIYTVPVTGGKATQLTRGLSFDEHPVWSPDGTRVAYVSDAPVEGSVWLLDPATRRTVPTGHRLTQDSVGWSRIEWAPDARSVAFNSQRGLRRIDPETGNSVQMATITPGAQVVISADGRWLAYISGELRIRYIETGEDRRLAHPVDPPVRYVFTPDSRAILIAYAGKLHRIDVATGEDRIIPLTVPVTLDLAPLVYHRHRVTNGPVPVRYIRSPDLSPDGRTVVFFALQRLYVMDWPGGTPRPLVEQDAGQFQPAFSPDGRWIAYVTFDELEGGHVWRVSIRGGNATRLTSLAGYYQQPAWSPDGGTLAVLSAGTRDATPDQPTNGTLLLLPSSGGPPGTVLEGVSRATPVTFTQDGQRLLVQEDSGRLVSMRTDGRDRRVMALLPDSGLFREPRRILPSPDGRWVAFVHRKDLYLAQLGERAEPLRLIEATRTPGVIRIAHGPLDFRWVHGGRMLLWVVGNQVFRLDPARALAAASQGGLPAGARVEPDAVGTIALTAPRYTARGTLVLRGARVITMRGHEVLEDATIVIKDDRIAAVGPSAAVQVPRGVPVVEMRGTTIMPGLVDLHAHFGPHMYDEVFRLGRGGHSLVTNLAYGVTTARDVSATNTQFGVAERVETGQLPGPRLFTVGHAVFDEQGDSSTFKIRSLEDARLAVRLRQALGAIVVKQYTNPTRQQRQWVYQAAHEAGINVTNEGAWDRRLELTMVLDGATGVEHAMSWSRAYGDVARLFREAGTWYTPTLTAEVPFGSERLFSALNDAKYRRFWEAGSRDSARVHAEADSARFDNASQTAAEIARQGGRVTVGSHGNIPGIGVHMETWALRMGGLTNHDALRAATIRGAEGLGVQQDLGSIEVGKIADLLVLDANPLQNIEHTLAIRYVMKNGVLYDGNTLDTLWPELPRLHD